LSFNESNGAQESAVEVRPSRGTCPNKTKREKPSKDQIEALYRDVLTYVGEDPDREGLLRTPHRVAEALAYLTQGYDKNVEQILNGAVFSEEYDDMVVVKDIEFYSLCEHHLLPFYGKVHVAYIPNGRIVGLSKIPRLVDMFARRLQVQERMTKEIAECLEHALAPRGVAVVVEGMHMCMMMRGVSKQSASMITSHVRAPLCTARILRVGTRVLSPNQPGRRVGPPTYRLVAEV
jgi:GTP cyclohydrolase I